jgi:hypothetical protein
MLYLQERAWPPPDTAELVLNTGIAGGWEKMGIGPE